MSDKERAETLLTYAAIFECKRRDPVSRMLFGPSEACKAAAAALRIQAASLNAERNGIYVASRIRHADMWKRSRADGVPIISTWIDQVDDEDKFDHVGLWARAQLEISRAERLVFFAERDDFPFKSALVEVGIAIAAGTPVYLVIDSAVQLSGRTLRPLGSWIKHPSVSWTPTLNEAFNIGRAAA